MFVRSATDHWNASNREHVARDTALGTHFKAQGTRHKAQGKCHVAHGKCHMANGESRMANGTLQNDF